ncbi:hypothetical protein [Ktedonospora formicarum]|uniref:Uncharacterized protein n=1 Tax=Ktedonospora formicarum TaxID=2778364 RepID=A0A8J3IAM1_9CHLR|nr:hypothetical protein [Ktedonospora formicarum]GHO48783.1 hypothetical protein KSX_69460 [Ktedonospora formicarum]
MSVLRFLPSSVTTLFSLYCIIWGLIASSVTIQMSGGAVFIGLLFLLLAYAHLRFALSYKHSKMTPSDQIG